MLVSVHVHVHNVYTCVFVSAYMSVHVCVCMCQCVGAHECVGVCAWHVCACAFMHMYMCVSACACVSTCVCVHTCVLVRVCRLELNCGWPSDCCSPCCDKVSLDLEVTQAVWPVSSHRAPTVPLLPATHSPGFQVYPPCLALLVALGNLDSGPPAPRHCTN